MSTIKDYYSFLISPTDPDTIKGTIDALKQNGIEVDYSMNYDFKNMRNLLGERDGDHFFERANNDYGEQHGGKLLSLKDSVKLL